MYHYASRSTMNKNLYYILFKEFIYEKFRYNKRVYRKS